MSLLPAFCSFKIERKTIFTLSHLLLYDRVCPVISIEHFWASYSTNNTASMTRRTLRVFCWADQLLNICAPAVVLFLSASSSRPLSAPTLRFCCGQNHRTATASFGWTLWGVAVVKVVAMVALSQGAAFFVMGVGTKPKARPQHQ